MRRAAACSCAAALLLVAACHDTIEAGATGPDAGVEDDPLAVDDSPAPGSLDEIHREIIVERCSGQPGLCHNGQFEPNLSTPAETYNWLVSRPAIEKPNELRVVPGEPDASFLVDKLRNRDVATQMPLGAEPLAEEEIQMIEDWIARGALRRPGAEPPEVLNQPPREPEIGVFDDAGERIDQVGGFSVPAGSSVTFRHSVSDYETPDPEIPIGILILQLPDGRRAVLSPEAADPGTGSTTYDEGGPSGAGDQLNYRYDLTIGSTIDVIDQQGNVTTEQASGLSFTPIVLYADELPGGIIAFRVSPSMMTVE